MTRRFTRTAPAWRAVRADRGRRGRVCPVRFDALPGLRSRRRPALGAVKSGGDFRLRGCCEGAVPNSTPHFEGCPRQVRLGTVRPGAERLVVLRPAAESQRWPLVTPGAPMETSTPTGMGLLALVGTRWPGAKFDERVGGGRALQALLLGELV